ncbi:autotransporter outer membrane beta-barrel domain-containing protein [Maritalea sp.]|uniref:autotransporter outer membrane beta-barrel domain-containing protein n=1 Tax=Maritalea sp. TaxID=2003361 RepID=UPI003EF69728
MGTYLVTADFNTNGYGLASITCSDTDSTTDRIVRTATIVVGASESVTCTFTLRETRGVTNQMIGDYLRTRNSFILNNQADRTRRFSRLKDAGISQESNLSINTPLGFAAQLPSPIAVSLNRGLLSYSGSARGALGFYNSRTGSANVPDIGKWDIWSEGSFNIFNDHNTQSGRFGVIHVGADYLLSDDVLLGAKAQIDWMNQAFASTNGKVEGTGFMVGPYATIALGENLFFDISGAWGMSQNAISPFGTYTDHFSTSRWMLDGALSGMYVLDGWTVRPTLAFSYIDENQNPYTDSLNVRIPGQRVAQGEISFAPYVSYDIVLENGGVLTPWLEMKGHYAFQASGTLSSKSYSDALNGFSASIGTGVDWNSINGSSISVSGQYDGIGTAASSYGVNIGVSVPLD